jgi:hypothetical protein
LKKGLITCITAIVASIFAATALAASTYRYTSTDGACSNVTFPQADFFGPGLTAPNAVDEEDASNIIASGGTFLVGYVASGATDIVNAAEPAAAGFVVGGVASNGESTYTSIETYTLATGDCPAATPTTAPRAEDGIFLCYSQWQIDPGVWPITTAVKLLAGGQYWLPVVETQFKTAQALGKYYLYCNGTMTGRPQLRPTGNTIVDDSGYAVSGAVAGKLLGVLGYYALAG